jgi:hypothetical protein
MIQEHTIGRIIDIKENGEAVIHAALPNFKHALDRLYDKVEIILPDGRRITPAQRRKCYSLIADLAEYVDGFRNAETIEEQKQFLKMEFCLQRMESSERRLFSLSSVDETTASSFIDFIIDFFVKHDIPTSAPLLEQCEDVGRYIYACAMARKCCVCGKPADIHHAEGSRIGMGNVREQVHHLGREFLPLCRAHHDECHHDEAGFIAKYHLQKIKLDEPLCKRLGLKK